MHTVHMKFGVRVRVSVHVCLHVLSHVKCTMHVDAYDEHMYISLIDEAICWEQFERKENH